MGFSDTWPNATAGGGGEDNQPPEPGIYEVALIDAGAFISKAGEEWVKLEWRDVATGHSWSVLLGFRSQAQANVTKGTLARLGVAVDEIAEFDQLDGALKPFIGRYYEVEVKQNGQFRNTYLNEPIEVQELPADVPDPEPSVAGQSGEDIPF